MTEQKEREQFRKIDTGNILANDLVATTNDRLELTVIELQNLQENNSEQTKKLDIGLKTLGKSIKNLNKTIIAANEKNDALQRWFLGLSIIGIIFAAIGLIQVADILVRGIGK
jgi:hypothetical protein